MYDDDGGMTADYDQKSGQLTKLEKTGTYAATRAAIDVQIATAKAYPRSLQNVSRNLIQYCASDNDTAESCVYSLKRGGKTIRGPSIRFAEILAHAWGHMRVDARIIDEGRDFIVVRGECHDLQSNNVWAQDVTRRITNSGGKRYDADLIGVTMMAAASIAQRDSVLKCIPAFIWRPAFDGCMGRIVGDVKLLSERRIKAVGQFSVLGVGAEQVFRKLGVGSINDITADHLVDLVGTFNAIREQHTTVEAEFGEQRICGTCRFFDQPRNECHERPPGPIVLGGDLYSVFPSTTRGSWCGRWIRSDEIESAPAPRPDPVPPAAETVDAYAMPGRGPAGVAAREQAQASGFTGEICDRCQSARMLRTGKCSTCQDCFATSGCS